MTYDPNEDRSDRYKRINSMVETVFRKKSISITDEQGKKIAHVFSHAAYYLYRNFDKQYRANSIPGIPDKESNSEVKEITTAMLQIMSDDTLFRQYRITAESTGVLTEHVYEYLKAVDSQAQLLAKPKPANRGRDGRSHYVESMNKVMKFIPVELTRLEIMTALSNWETGRQEDYQPFRSALNYLKKKGL